MKKILLLSMIISGFFLNAQIGTSTQIGGENSKWTFGGYAGLGGAFGNGGGVSLYVTPRVGSVSYTHLDVYKRQKLLLKKSGQTYLSDEAQTLRIFLFRGNQTDFFCDFPNFRFR